MPPSGQTIQDPESPSPEQQRFEKGLISIFGELADLFGNPRSYGEVYATLFSSPKPMTMEEISKRVGFSMGSVSIALRALEAFGAVERKVIIGKAGAYAARLELKTLISGFVRQRLIPRMEKSTGTLKELSALVKLMPADEAREAEFRLQRITQWHTRATQFLPLAEKILQSVPKFLSKDVGQ